MLRKRARKNEKQTRGAASWGGARASGHVRAAAAERASLAAAPSTTIGPHRSARARHHHRRGRGHADHNESQKQGVRRRVALLSYVARVTVLASHVDCLAEEVALGAAHFALRRREATGARRRFSGCAVVPSAQPRSWPTAARPSQAAARPPALRGPPRCRPGSRALGWRRARKGRAGGAATSAVSTRTMGCCCSGGCRASRSKASQSQRARAERCGRGSRGHSLLLTAAAPGSPTTAATLPQLMAALAPDTTLLKNLPRPPAFSARSARS